MVERLELCQKKGDTIFRTGEEGTKEAVGLTYRLKIVSYKGHGEKKSWHIPSYYFGDDYFREGERGGRNTFPRILYELIQKGAAQRWFMRENNLCTMLGQKHIKNVNLKNVAIYILTIVNLVQKGIKLFF